MLLPNYCSQNPLCVCVCVCASELLHLCASSGQGCHRDSGLQGESQEENKLFCQLYINLQGKQNKTVNKSKIQFFMTVKSLLGNLEKKMAFN